MIAQMYVIVILDILIPIIGLVVLRRWKKYSWTAVFVGIACYFLVTQILLSLMNLLFSAFGFTEEFWNSHVLLNEILNMLFNVAFMQLSLYLAMRYTMKHRLTLYDAMAAGISYYLGNGFMQAYYGFYSIRLLELDRDGLLSEVATEDMPLETLEQSVQSLYDNGLAVFYVQMAALLVMTFLAMTVCMYLYYAIKKPDGKVAVFSIVIHYALMLTADLALELGNVWWYLAAVLMVLCISIGLYVHFRRWYRRQQLEYARRLKAYKEHIKTKEPAGN